MQTSNPAMNGMANMQTTENISTFMPYIKIRNCYLLYIHRTELDDITVIEYCTFYINKHHPVFILKYDYEV